MKITKFILPVFRGVLQPIHVLFFLVNAANPPTFDVITVLVLVWSPPAHYNSLLYILIVTLLF